MYTTTFARSQTTNQLKVRPVQLFPWKKENKHALLVVYQLWALPWTPRTWVHPATLSGKDSGEGFGTTGIDVNLHEAAEEH